MRLDSESFSRVAEELRPFLVRKAAFRIGWPDAEDVVQDTITALWRHIERNGHVDLGVDDPWIWFLRATTNRIVDLTRHRKLRPDTFDRIDLSPHVWDNLRASGEVDPSKILYMEQRLAKLKPSDRRAVLMRLAGYTWREISTDTNYTATRERTERAAKRIVPTGTDAGRKQPRMKKKPTD